MPKFSYYISEYEKAMIGCKVEIFTEKKMVVYTAVFGGYDLIFKPLCKSFLIDYIVFSDIDCTEINGWRNIYIGDFLAGGLSLSGKNRYIKLFAHRLLSNYSYSIYVDSNIRVLPEIDKLFKRLIDSQIPFAVPRHPSRSRLLEEVEACERLRKTNDYMRLRQEYQSYLEYGFDDSVGLTENNIIFRDHADPNLDKMMAEWWSLIVDGVGRDQISLPFLRWKYDWKVLMLDQNARDKNLFFGIYPHYKRRFIRLPLVLFVAKSYEFPVLKVILSLAYKIKYYKDGFIKLINVAVK